MALGPVTVPLSARPFANPDDTYTIEDSMTRITVSLRLKTSGTLLSLIAGLAACAEPTPLAPTEAPVTVGRPLAGPPICIPVPSRYTVTDLGSLPGGEIFGFTQASGINDQGDIVGSAVNASGNQVPFVRPAGGTMTALPLPSGSVSGDATDINNHGVIVGSTSGTVNQATLWSSGSPRSVFRLGTLGGPFSIARALNESAQVVGQARTASGAIHAFIWDAARSPNLQDLGALGASESDALDINDAGVVSGTLSTGGVGRAFLWTYPYRVARGGIVGGMSDLGPGDGKGINNSQFIAGAFQGMAAIRAPSGNWQSFMAGSALDINDLGSATILSAKGLPFVVSGTGAVMSLPLLPGGVAAAPFAINMCQQVVGNMVFGDGNIHAVLWDPLPGA